jgi:tetratricopeptide (TPR) repeat protein
MGKQFVAPVAALLATLVCTFQGRAMAAHMDFQKQLQEADRRAWLTDWYSALPIYSEVEKAATIAGDRRAAMYAKFGRLRGQMQTMSLADASEQLAVDLETVRARRDAKLRLRGFTVKGDIDLEWNVQAADHDWQQVRQVARELGDKGWENRANGELGMIAFLKGNTGEATTLVRGALESATQSGDVGGQLRYMGAIANGLYLAGYAPLALGYVDRALKFSSEHPEAGFPFVVYSTKALTLMALNQPDEAEQFAKTALAAAHAGDRRIKTIELSMMLAQIAEKRGQMDRALEYLKQAATSARAGHVQRLLADTEEGLAEAYRARGDLVRARRDHALSAVNNTELAGSRFTLPIRLGILADIYAAQGRPVAAARLYDQAADIVEGIMVNVPSRDAQARLIGVMSNLYAGQFRLVADRLNNPAKAYQVVGRVRGRALADVLRSLPDSTQKDEGAATDQTRAISRLQVRLMKARMPTASTTLMRRFYENVTAGRDIAEALTRAKHAVTEQLSPDALTTVAASQLVGIGDQPIRTKNQAPKATGGEAR